MILINKVDVGGFTGKIYQSIMAGRKTYTYKIFHNIKGKNECINRSYVNFLDNKQCYDEMKENLDVCLGFKDDLFDWRDK